MEEIQGNTKKAFDALAAAVNADRAVSLLHAPGVGAGRILRQFAADTLLNDVPAIYLDITQTNGDAISAARSIAYRTLLQVAAIRRKNPKIIDVEPTLGELYDLMPAPDRSWFSRAVDAFSSPQQTLGGLVRFPLRAQVTGMRLFPVIDGLHNCLEIDGGEQLLDEIMSVYALRPSITAGRRRVVLPYAAKHTIDMPLPDHDPAAAFAETAAIDAGVDISDRCRDLLVQQLGPVFQRISMLIASAADERRPMNKYSDLQAVYVQSVAEGRLASWFRRVFSSAFPEPRSREAAIALLYEAFAEDGGASDETIWLERTRLSPADLKSAATILDGVEFIRYHHGRIEAELADPLLNDLLTAAFRLGAGAENPEIVKAEMIMQGVKGSPRQMEKLYRSRAALSPKRLLQRFDGQHIPAALIDGAKFRAEYKGAPDEEVMRDTAASEDNFQLPRVAHTAYISDLYPPLSVLGVRERSAAGFGFEGMSFDHGHQIVWLAAEVDSKLEAESDVVDFWCDRLEMAAVMCGFERYQIWLIAPEGFSDAGQNSLVQRNALGSSKKQFELLERFLDESNGRSFAAEEFEIIVPMDGDSEMVAAHALEDIARRHNFKGKAINQIKTALIEACINASEHSLSTDRRIHQKFRVEDGRLVVTVSNRGLRLADRPTAKAGDERRRGWGLQLIEKLMDDVRIEETEDGTSISMTKLVDTTD